MNTKINSSFGIFDVLGATNAVWCLGVIKGAVRMERNPSLYATMATVENALNLMPSIADNEEFFIYPADTDDLETADRLTFIRAGDTIQVQAVRLGGVTYKLTYATVLNYFHPAPAPEQGDSRFTPFQPFNSR